MYNTFECHFQPNQKRQRDSGDPVVAFVIVEQSGAKKPGGPPVGTERFNKYWLTFD